LEELLRKSDWEEVIRFLGIVSFLQQLLQPHTHTHKKREKGKMEQRKKRTKTRKESRESSDIATQSTLSLPLSLSLSLFLCGKARDWECLTNCWVKKISTESRAARNEKNDFRASRGVRIPPIGRCNTPPELLVSLEFEAE
jgi:hypothetical protein